jgi:peroxiredoxin
MYPISNQICVARKEQGMALRAGDPAPDFDLPAVEGERQTRVRLSDFRGKKHVVVAFHPLDWTPT